MIGVFVLDYDALVLYARAFVQSKGASQKNDECLYAALCIKFHSLELDWEFFELLHAKRTKIDAGEQLTYEDWKKIKLKLTLHISSLAKEFSHTP